MGTPNAQELGVLGSNSSPLPPSYYPSKLLTLFEPIYEIDIYLYIRYNNYLFGFLPKSSEYKYIECKLLLLSSYTFSSTPDLELLLKFAERAGIAEDGAPLKLGSVKLNLN